MSKTQKVHGPYYLEYKDWNGSYRPVKNANTSGYATHFKTITEARKKALSIMIRNSPQLVGIQGAIGRREYDRDGRPIVQGGIAGIVEADPGVMAYVYRDYNSGNSYRLNRDGLLGRRV